MIRLLIRFFDDIHRIANILASDDVTTYMKMPTIVVTLSQEDRDLLSKYRRNKPRVKSGDAA